MRRVRFGGAMSLDGYIAGPQGEYDWIVPDPEMDFAAMKAEFDTFLIGRKTFDAMDAAGIRRRARAGARPGTRGESRKISGRLTEPDEGFDCPGGMIFASDEGGPSSIRHGDGWRGGGPDHDGIVAWNGGGHGGSPGGWGFD
jgi:RibD C-terminal domain